MSIDLLADRAAVLRLAAETPCDVRTARKALMRGTLSLSPLTRERLVRAAKTLGIVLPATTTTEETRP